jgi:hypothetical protein
MLMTAHLLGPVNEMIDINPSSSIAVLRANFGGLADAKRGERDLGALCSDGRFELLDAVLFDWPAAEPRPGWRALHNVARVAALGDDVWAGYVDRLGPGSSAIVAFVPTEHQAAVADRLTMAGAEVTTDTLSATEYERLRQV